MEPEQLPHRRHLLFVAGHLETGKVIRRRRPGRKARSQQDYASLNNQMYALAHHVWRA